jgi:hypothetical protein
VDETVTTVEARKLVEAQVSVVAVEMLV